MTAAFTNRWLLGLAVLGVALLACSGGSSTKQSANSGVGGAGGAPDRPLVAGKKVALSLSPADTMQLDAFSTQLASLKNLSTAQLLEQHTPNQSTSLGYDPSAAQSLDAIQASPLRLDTEELSVLTQRGFVVSAKQVYPSMLYGYKSIYSADLPVYVSADSILDAVHRSYDAMLKAVEQTTLIPELQAMLGDMRSELSARPAGMAGAKDADFFLAVAKSLLDGAATTPVAGASATDIASFYAAAMKASGHEMRVIFGAKRDIDFSQFTPRGHYTDSEELGQYFRTMMWLGRIDLRLIETQSDGTQVFHREQLETASMLRELLTDAGLARWQRIDATIEAFVGKSDNMRVPDVDALLQDLGVADAAGLSKLSDQKIAQTIIDRGYGAQLIASQLIVNATPDQHTLPLDRSFAFFGQRYTVDSHVLANVVFDRVPNRLMPSPLDAAYAALGNDQAAQLLQPELDRYHYAPALESMRTLVDAHGDSFFQSNLYNLWLTSLRELSPTSAHADPQASGLPSVTRTETWGRRLLNTQLASWAELRHDTILYVKQSYTGGAVCVFPGAYVDPYPQFYAALVTFAERGSALADTLADASATTEAQNMHLYFDHLHETMTELRDMADAERQGQPFTADQMAFINRAVRQNPEMVCGLPPRFNGWYAELIYGALPGGEISEEFDPTIADVHTQPTDAAGNDVGRILHVGTGFARLMVVTADGCDGVKAYAGLAMAYHEKITENWKRLTDPEWADIVQGTAHPADVPWASDFVAGASSGM